MGAGRTWTQEEKVYLSDNYGNISIGTLAKNLNRSKYSILVKRTREGLGRSLDSGEYISYCQFLQALYGLDAGSAYRNMRSWEDFPLKRKKVDKNSFKIVYINEFWEWAEHNRRKIDFSKMEEGALGPEPDWVSKKRRIDFECRLKKSPWTKSEDWLLQKLLKEYKYTYTQIAARLGRTEGAVKRRIFDTGLRERPLKNENREWTQDEVVTLVFMYHDGWSFEKIGEKLNRSALGCRGKMEHVENPGIFLRVNRRKENET